MEIIIKIRNNDNWGIYTEQEMLFALPIPEIEYHWKAINTMRGNVLIKVQGQCFVP